MNSVLIWAAAFVVSSVVDVAWTRYFIETEKRNAVGAGIWSAGIMAFGLFNTSLFIDHRWVVGSACVLGGFFGTWITIKLSK